jgi:ABC-2 type transport system permease protein
MDFKEKFQYSLNNKFLTLVVLGILITVNVLSLQFFVRFDWTENDRYSISDSTKVILEELDDLMTITAYLSPDLPPQLVTAEQYLKDILSEYQAYGSGNVQLDIVSVDDNDRQAEALAAGMAHAEMRVLENDSYQVRKAFFGIQLMYQGKSEAIPLVQEAELGNLEYDLTSMALKMTQPKLNKVAFLLGHGEHGIQRSLAAPAPNEVNDYTALADSLRKNYEVATVDFSKGQSLEGVDVLVVAGPKRDLSARDVFEIDQYLLAGGKSLFMIDAIEIPLGGVAATPLDTNLKTLLSPLGLTVKSNLLLDALAEFANFQIEPGRSFILPYPLFIRLVNENFSNHPVIQKVAAMVVRFVSSIEVAEIATLNYDKFLNTSPAGWQQEGPTFQTDPNNLPPGTPELGGSQSLGVLVTGLMPRISDATSFPPLQKWEENAEGQYEFVISDADDNSGDREILTEATQETSLFLISDSDFVQDIAVQGDITPLVVVQNIVDFLSLGEELINIRSKSLGSAPLDVLENSEKSLMKFLGILFIPLLLSAYGFLRLWLRRKEEKLLNL